MVSLTCNAFQLYAFNKCQACKLNTLISVYEDASAGEAGHSVSGCA